MLPDVKEITVARGETLNLGQFNSYRVDLSITARVRPEEDPDQIYDQLLTWVESNIATELENVKK